jgi:hypothetical protein
MSFYNDHITEKKAIARTIKDKIPLKMNVTDEKSYTDLRKIIKHNKRNNTTKDQFFSGDGYGDKFWFEQPSFIFDPNRLSEFFPNEKMNYNEKLNAILRFSIYLSILLMLIKNSYLYIYICIVVAFLTYLLYVQNKKMKKEEFQLKGNMETATQKKDYSLPSKDNPFMNMLLPDIKYNPAHKGYKHDDNIRQKIEKNFNHNLYKDISDVFNKDHSQRQYYTMPSTSIPNEQDKFANWLYKVPTTCKSGNGTDCNKLQSPNMNMKNQLYKYAP